MIGWFYCVDNQPIPFQGIVPGLLPRPERECDYNLGDVILGMPVIAEGCGSEGGRLEHRLPVIVTHGLCHLLGYKHKTSTQWREVSVHAGSFTLCVLCHVTWAISCTDSKHLSPSRNVEVVRDVP